MKHIRFLFEAISALVIGLISSMLSKSNRTRFGKFLGHLIRLLVPNRARISLNNIAKAFPEKSSEWHKNIMLKSFENLGITLVELLALGSLSENQIKEYVQYENIELIQQVYERGRGVILLSGHYGNWEFLAYSVFVYLRLPVLIIVKPLSNYVLDKIINKYRTRLGNQIVSMYEAAFKVARNLKNGGIVALLADQSATKDKDVFVDFFGIPSATFESPAFLALKYKVPIVVGFAERRGSTYFVHLEELRFDDLEFSKESIFELTQRHTKKLEEAIRRCPELWVWQHRRWKHTSEYIERQ